MFKSFAKQVFAFSLTRTLTRRGVFTDGQAMCSLAPVFHRGKGSEGFNIQPQSTRQYPTPYDFITGCHRGINPSFSIRHTCSACIESSIHKNIVRAHQHTHSHTMGPVRYAAFTLLLPTSHTEVFYAPIKCASVSEARWRYGHQTGKQPPHPKDSCSAVGWWIKVLTELKPYL